MHWRTYARTLQIALRASVLDAAESDAVLEVVLDAVTELVAVARADALRRADGDEGHLAVAALHLDLARTHAMPAGPSAVPGDLPPADAVRDARALLAAAIDVLAARDGRVVGGLATCSARGHLRAAVRVLGREPLIPAQRGSRGARTP